MRARDYRAAWNRTVSAIEPRGARTSRMIAARRVAEVWMRAALERLRPRVLGAPYAGAVRRRDGVLEFAFGAAARLTVSRYGAAVKNPFTSPPTALYDGRAEYLVPREALWWATAQPAVLRALFLGTLRALPVDMRRVIYELLVQPFEL